MRMDLDKFPRYEIDEDKRVYEKVTGREVLPKGLIVTLQKEDVSSLSFADETFDAATTSFGIRNFDKLDESIREIHRVLKPLGKFVILEMSEPKTPVIRQGYLLYTRTVIPFAVKTFSNDPLAYKYLTDSMKVFPQGKEMIAILKKNGFRCLKYKTFFLGVCSLYVLEKE